MLTSIYAALCAILVVVLAARVVFFRRAHKIGIGLAENRDLERRVRVHANAVEYVPLALVLLGLLELGQTPGWVIHLFGASFFICRVLHAYGLNKTVRTSLGRLIGTLGSWIIIVLMSVMLLVHTLMGMQ